MPSEIYKDSVLQFRHYSFNFNFILTKKPWRSIERWINISDEFGVL